MPTLHDVAYAHLKRRQRLTERAASRALRLWRMFDLNDLDRSWAVLADRLVAEVAQAQEQSAALAAPYMAAVQRASGETPVAAPVAVPAYSGVVLDGRELGPAMFGAVTTTKELIGVGRPPREAFTVGAAFLATVVGNAVQDMGRQADLVAGVPAHRLAYVRVVQPGACSRCAVQAGKSVSRNPFLRHPRCRCQSLPVRADGRTPNGFFDTPEDYFESLSRAEQDRIFTKAGAAAIRAGADPVKVVNARRGAYGIGYSGHYNIPVPVGTRNTLQRVTIGVKPDGSPLQVFATTEGVSRRGRYGRNERSTSIRLMPEQILRMAGDDPDRLLELLKRYGYLY